MYKLIVTIAKDVRILVRDRVGLLLMFFMPILLVIIIASIQDSTFELAGRNRIVLLFANRDAGNVGKDLVEAVGRIGMFRLVEVPGDPGDAQLAERVRAGDAMLALVIPRDLSTTVTGRANRIASEALKRFGLEAENSAVNESGNPASITLYYHPVLQETLRRSAQGALRSALRMVESRQTLRQLYVALNDEELPVSMENDVLDSQLPIDEIPVSGDGSRAVPNTSQHNVPAWTIFAMFFVVSSLGSSIVREKLSGSFLRLKSLPTSYLVALLSKQITYMGVTLIQATLIFSIGVWLFPYMNLPTLNLPSDLCGLLVVTLLCGWCAVSYAICVGVFSETQEQANGFGAVSIVILAALGGLMVPTFLMPDSFKSIVELSPLHWCLEAYYDLFLVGGDLSDVARHVMPLIGITAFMQLLTIWGLKRRDLI